EVLESVDALDDDARAVCLFAAAMTLSFGSRAHQAPALLGQAAEAAGRGGLPDVERMCRACLAWGCFLMGLREEAEEFAAGIDGDPGRSVAAMTIRSGRAYSAWSMGRFQETRRLLAEGSPDAQPRLSASRELLLLLLDLAEGVDSGSLPPLEARLEEARR